MTLARLSGTTLGYGAGAVLSDLSLTLDPGERLVLLGRSGVGKTTLLAHLHDQMTGAGQRVALVPQDHALVPQLSVLRNVLMGRLDDHGALYNLRSFAAPRARQRAEVTALLADLALEGLADRPVGALSGGQKQRVALARGLYRGGTVMLGDEPVSAVDETQGPLLMDLIAARFATAVVALHDVGLARRFGTRLLGLRDGRILFDAAPGAVEDAQMAALYAD